MKHIIIALLIFVMSRSGEADAAPNVLSFSGKLSTAEGPVQGPVNINFEVFTDPTGGTSMWSDSAALTVEQGFVSVLLGRANNPINETVFDGGDRFLEITIQGEVLSPRLQITSVPYAIQSNHTADPTVQRRTAAASSMICPAGTYMRSIDPTGQVACKAPLTCSHVNGPSSSSVSDASCPSGSVLTGGGCVAPGPVAIQDSIAVDLNTWRCRVGSSSTVAARAICCKGIP